jgi:hypothetical protein
LIYLKGNTSNNSNFSFSVHLHDFSLIPAFKAGDAAPAFPPSLPPAPTFDEYEFVVVLIGL